MVLGSVTYLLILNIGQSTPPLEKLISIEGSIPLVPTKIMTQESI